MKWNEIFWLHSNQFLLVFVCVLCLTIFWYIFYHPLEVRRSLTDVGFYHVAESIKNADDKKIHINRARRLRSVGEKMPPPFPNGWFSILESHELKVGQSKSIDVLGQNLAVFRDDFGKVHILDAYCPHMGANLGVGGIVRGNCIECPFHQWNFRGSNGECTSIPYSSGAIPKNTKARTWKSCEIAGTIFMWYHVDNAEPWDIQLSPEVENGEWVYHGMNENFVNCHIQEIPENGADPAHLATLHGPCITSGSDLRKTRSIWSTIAQHTWSASWNVTETPHVACVDMSHSVCLLNTIKLWNMTIKAKQIGPGCVELLMHTTYGPLVCLQTVTPVEPLVQRVVHRFYSPRYLAWMAKLTFLGERIQFERDVMVWNNKKFIDNPMLVKEDRQIKAYRMWFSQFYSENSKPFFKATKNSMEW